VPDYVPESYVQSATESRSKYFVWSAVVPTTRSSDDAGTNDARIYAGIVPPSI